ncbi:unnamed protein product [Lampetra planeri]
MRTLDRGRRRGAGGEGGPRSHLIRGIEAHANWSGRVFPHTVATCSVGVAQEGSRREFISNARASASGTRTRAPYAEFPSRPTKPDKPCAAAIRVVYMERWGRRGLSRSDEAGSGQDASLDGARWAGNVQR